MKKAVRKINKTESDKWVIFSFCGEEQTCADAWFNGRANGAGTYYDLKSYNTGSTYKIEIVRIKLFLPNSNFDQIPELSGNSILFDNKVLT